MIQVLLRLVRVVVCVGLAATASCPTKLNASGILFQFNTPFPTDPSPAGSGPWVDAFFQNVSPGTVLLTITNVGFASGEFVGGNGNGANGGFFFNLNTNDNPVNLAFTLVSANGSFGQTISTGQNAFKADGDGYYDIQFDFSTHAFSVNSSMTYRITGITNLTAADFAYLSAVGGGGESGPFYAAAHIQGLSGGNSTWLEPGGGPVITRVPEPAPIALLAVSAILLVAFRLQRLRENIYAVLATKPLRQRH
jgi:hypothetical protein